MRCAPRTTTTIGSSQLHRTDTSPPRSTSVPTAESRAVRTRPAAARCDASERVSRLLGATQALAAYDSAIAITPTDYESHIGRAEALTALDDPMREAEAYRAALRLKPGCAGPALCRVACETVCCGSVAALLRSAAGRPPRPPRSPSPSPP